MKRKKLLSLILLSCLMVLCCFFGAFGWNIGQTRTASADTTPRYTVLFSYTNNKIVSNVGNNSTTKYRSGTNVSSASVLDNDGSNMTFRIYAYGSDYSGSGTLTNGGWIGSSTVNISFNSTYTDHTITVTDSSGKEVKKVTKTTSIQLTGLTHGSTYNVSYLGFGLGTGSATLMTRYELTASFSFKVDLKNPTITGASTTMYDVMSNQVVTVNGVDADSGVKYMYKKHEDASSYTRIVGSLTKIYLDDGPGLYSFYAEDNAGRTSAIYYAYYDAVLPVGKFYNSSGTLITSSYYNNAFKYTATDEGFGLNYCQYKTPGTTTWQTYSNGTTIAKTATNGLYTFRSHDLLGNTSEESTMYLDTVAPVGKVYANGTLLSSGGTTTASSLYYSATDTGGVATCYVKAPGSNSYVEYVNGSSLTTSGSYSFYCVDHAGNQSSVYTVLMDHDSPTISCDETEFGDTIGKGFTVRASDAIGTCTLYYKNPNSSSYQSTTSGYVTIPVTSTDGKYYFYAKDSYGNTTATYWIELDVATPTATIVKSSTDNRVYATWTGTTITATLNGSAYTKGTWISAEGNYTLNITDSTTGRANSYSFSIGHYYEKGATIAPTCTAQGYTVYECISCDDYYYDDYISPNGHSYRKTVTPPTCTAQGYTVYTCTVCDYTYTGDIVAAKGHSYTREVVPPTCTTQGYTVSTCSACGYSYISDYVSALGHNYVANSFEANCTDKGGVQYICSRCGDSYTVYTSSALGHRYYEELVLPSCEGEGYLKHLCTECGYSYKTDEEKALGHEYTTWIQSHSDCEHDGQRIHYCNRCGGSYITIIPCRGHSYSTTDTQIENGTKRNFHCETCGDEYVEYIGDQYTMVSNYVEYLFDEYAPYMVTIFLVTAGVWSLAMGIAVIIAYRNEDKLKARKMVVNYLIGLVVIFAILVAAPYLVRGVAYLVAH